MREFQAGQTESVGVVKDKPNTYNWLLEEDTASVHPVWVYINYRYPSHTITVIHCVLDGSSAAIPEGGVGGGNDAMGKVFLIESEVEESRKEAKK